MRFFFLFALAIFLAVPSQAKDEAPASKLGPLKVLRQPIVMDWGASPLLAVTFNHTTHKTIKCRFCHHMEPEEGSLYAPCTTCHDIKGARERDPMSMFMAYHAPSSDRSCYGCHTREASNHPEFVGCRPCHMSPQARKEQAEAKQAAANK